MTASSIHLSFQLQEDGRQWALLPVGLLLTQRMLSRQTKLLLSQQAVIIRPTLTLETFLNPRGLQREKSSKELARGWESLLKRMFSLSTEAGETSAWGAEHGRVITRRLGRFPLRGG